MSFTTSAATALFTILDNDPEDGDRGRHWEDQTQYRDLYTQFVISFALGLGAFVAFCVGLGLILGIIRVLSLTLIQRTGAATKVDGAICCAEATTLRRLGAARTTRQLLWMDTCSIPDYGRGGLALRRP